MKKAIVLGGTAPHADLIQKLQKRGYYVILIDYFDNPIAKKFADKHIKESTLDKEAVLQIAKDEKADLVISTFVDQANAVACYVAEKLNLPHPYSYETALDATIKGRMKKIFKEKGILTPDYYLWSEKEPLIIKYDFPFVIKPTDANSSKGVFLIRSEEELKEKITETLSFSREKKVIVEKFVKGTEVQVDCVAIDSKAHVLTVKDMISMPFDGNELNVSGCISPGEVCMKFYDELCQVAQKIVDGYGFKSTVFFYQAKCNEEGVWVLEFGARGAGGTTYEQVGIRAGIDYQNLAIDTFMQNPVAINFNFSNKKFISKFIYIPKGIFQRVDGVEDLMKKGIIFKYYPSMQANEFVDGKTSSNNRICSVVTEGDTYDEAWAKMRQVDKQLKVIYEKM